MSDGDGGESRSDQALRYAQRTKLYVYAGAAVLFLIVLIALIASNTRQVKLSYVFGSGKASLVWIVIVPAVVGWLLGIVTSVLFRRRTRRPG